MGSLRAYSSAGGTRPQRCGDPLLDGLGIIAPSGPSHLFEGHLLECWWQCIGLGHAVGKIGVVV